MADSFNTKEREKKRKKKNRDKQYDRQQKKLSSTKPPEFMYVGEDGNLTTQAPDPSLRKKISLDDIDVSTPRSVKSEESRYEKQGFVKFLNHEKGYGFIVENDTNESFFVHVDSLDIPLKDGDQVTFEAGKGPKGPIAQSVRLRG